MTAEQIAKFEKGMEKMRLKGIVEKKREALKAKKEELQTARGEYLITLNRYNEYIGKLVHRGKL